MSWYDKQIKKQQAEKMAKELMNTKEYKDAQKQDRLHSFALLCLTACDYLELKEGYRKKRILNFLQFMSGRMKYIADDNPDYCLEMNDYFKDEYGIDVLGTLGVKLEREGTNGENRPQAATE